MLERLAEGADLPFRLVFRPIPYSSGEYHHPLDDADQGSIMPQEEEPSVWKFYLAPDFDEPVEVAVEPIGAKRLHQLDPHAWRVLIEFVHRKLRSG